MRFGQRYPAGFLGRSRPVEPHYGGHPQLPRDSLAGKRTHSCCWKALGCISCSQSNSGLSAPGLGCRLLADLLVGTNRS